MLSEDGYYAARYEPGITKRSSSEAAMVRLGIVDATLCAAQHSIWRGAGAPSILLGCVGRLDQAGFDALDIMDGPLFEHFVLRGENPWSWIRRAATQAARTPLNAWVCTTTLFGAIPLDPDIISAGITCLVRAGVGRITVYDPFNDPARLQYVARVAREAGARCCAALIFMRFSADASSTVPEIAAQMAGHVDGVCLWDPAGAMNPEAARALIPALRKATGDTALELRVHCQSGLAEIIYLEAVASSVEVLHTAADALAGGTSLPSFDYFASQLGDNVGHVDTAKPAGISEHIRGYADRHELPIGCHTLPDLDAARFEVPYDLLPRIEAIAKSQSDHHALLEECCRVRALSGGMGLVRPLGGLVVQQAASILGLGAGNAALPAGDGTRSAPLEMIERLRSCRMSERAHPPEAADDAPPEAQEALVTAAMFGRERADALSLRDTAPPPMRADTPFTLLIDELNRRPFVRRISVEKGAWRFELGSWAT